MNKSKSPKIYTTDHKNQGKTNEKDHDADEHLPKFSWFRTIKSQLMENILAYTFSHTPKDKRIQDLHDEIVTSSKFDFNSIYL